jgi:hypothetical protein
MTSRRGEDFDVVVPTRAGKDLQSKDGKIDGHIRIESYKGVGTKIYVDLFVSAVRDPDKAHITSESFPWTDGGAKEATKFLQENGFQVAVAIK